MPEEFRASPTSRCMTRGVHDSRNQEGRRDLCASPSVLTTLGIRARGETWEANGSQLFESEN